MRVDEFLDELMGEPVANFRQFSPQFRHAETRASRVFSPLSPVSPHGEERAAFQYRTHGAVVDLKVAGAKVIDLQQEARRRGLIRFRLTGNDGAALLGFSLEVPRPGEDQAGCIARLRAEFGGRLVLDAEGSAND
ncbi:hypothetical protein ACW73L_15985 [Methylolobus aquaticus]